MGSTRQACRGAVVVSVGATGTRGSDRVIGSGVLGFSCCVRVMLLLLLLPVVVDVVMGLIVTPDEVAVAGLKNLEWNK